jgi:hypothetical protein
MSAVSFNSRYRLIPEWPAPSWQLGMMRLALATGAAARGALAPPISAVLFPALRIALTLDKALRYAFFASISAAMSAIILVSSLCILRRSFVSMALTYTLR